MRGEETVVEEDDNDDDAVEEVDDEAEDDMGCDNGMIGVCFGYFGKSVDGILRLT